MSITHIVRDWGTDPAIVRISTTDSLATITTTGYLLTQEDEIQAINAGAFEWLTTDYVLCYYSDNGGSWGFFTYIPGTGSLAAAAVVPGSLSATLASGNIFVGNASNAATGVAMSGAATISNAGVVSLAANAVNSAALAPTVLKYAAVPITAAEFNGMYGAPKLLVAAGGANTLLVLDRMVLAMTYNSAAYAAGGVAAAQYDSTINGAGVQASSTTVASAFQATASTSYPSIGGVVAAPFATTVNKGLYLSNITAAFTTGDSPMVAHVWYKVIQTV